MEVAANFPSYDHNHHHLHSAATAADDDYIDMEINSFSILANQNPREFEFHMSKPPLEKQYHSTTSPADELFYKGKLLPLHLPPRLQMFEKLLENSNGVGTRKVVFEEYYSTPMMTTTPTATNTPYESCNITPAGSCTVSRELNPEEYLLEYSSSQVSGYIDIGENNPKRPSWARKLKLIKQTALFGSKIKAFKALFGKSGCSNDSCTAAAAARVADEGTLSKASKEAGIEGCGKAVGVKKAPFGHIQTEKYQFLPTSVSKQKSTTTSEDCSGNRLHRRSFSMAIKRNSTAKSSMSTSSSSSSSSLSTSSSLTSSNGYRGLPFLKRSTSTVCSEIENPIQGAIAHCKKSQEMFQQRKSSVSEVGFYSMSGSKISICEEPERADLCRG
ncbi:unnamed protein product [Linum tenue]|uniref:Membrane-associated kinase regulator 4 n=1 Tax=Linum tenue TaxID=586396 RepID=A0AAV0JNI2_9ROSI|nr:unnamed protein product [Linum tenue]